MTANPTAAGRLLKFIPYMSVAAFLIGWQLIVSLGMVPKMLLAAPLGRTQAFYRQADASRTRTARFYTCTCWSASKKPSWDIFLHLAIGIPLGLLMGWFHTVEGFARPIFEMIRPIPAVAWIPLTIFWFGIGLSGKVFIIWLSGIVPCVINSFVGVTLTNPTSIQMARTYGASKWRIFRTICVPSALPMVFGALQMALAACWTTLVAAELIAANTGLGFLITMGRRLTMPDMVVLGMVLVGLTGFVIGVIIDAVEKKLLAGIRR